MDSNLRCLPATPEGPGGTVVSPSLSGSDDAVLSNLSPEQQDRLTQILDDYLVALASGTPLQRDEIIARNPDLASEIRRHLSSLDFLQDAAGGFGDSVLPEDDDAEEQKLSDFRLLKEIGRGGMGVVYEAWQGSLGRRVAVKVLPFASVLDSRQIARFQNEAQAAAQLNHPNIVPVFAFGQDRGVHFYAMQLIDGQTLEEIIRTLRQSAPDTACWSAAATDAPALPGQRRAGQASSEYSATDATADSLFSPATRYADVARLGVQAANALHAAHEVGIIHRDVKPSNLIVDDDAKVWIADFGLARCQSDRSLTRTGDLVGTVRYMSPEQARGESAAVDHRSDVYSLGATLYELTTLHTVFEELDGPALLCRIEQGEPTRPRTLRSDIPPDLENIILRAMAPVREERYATALEFAEDLQRFVDGRPTRAVRRSLLDRAGRWARRHRKSVAWSITLLLVLTIGSAFSTLLLYRETLRTDAALAQSERNRARSQANYRKAREIVDQLGARVAEQLADVAGAEGVRHTLLHDMLSYYREFAEQSDDDMDLRHDVATTYSSIAALTEHLGSSADALAAEVRAGDLFRELIAEEPHDVQHRAHLAICLNNQGLLLFRLGQATESESRYREALALQQAISTRDPDAVAPLRDLALTWNNLALLLSQTGRTEEAKSGYAHALAIQRDLTERQPDNHRLLRHLAATTLNHAAMLETLDPVAAEHSYAEAIATMQSLTGMLPDPAAFRSDLALAHNNFGAFLSSQHKLADAVEQYRAAILLQAELVARAPESVAYRQDLAMSHNNLGLALSRNGQPRQAEAAFRDAVTHQQQVLLTDSQNVSYLGSLGGIHNNLALTLEETGNLHAAGDEYALAVARQESALALAPGNESLRDFLCRTCFNAGRVARHNNQPQRAIRMALRRQELSAGNPERLLSVAKELTLVSHLLPKQSSAASGLNDDQCLKLAAGALQRAIDSGLTHLTEQDAIVFREVQTDSRFVALLTRVAEHRQEAEPSAPSSVN